MNRKRLEGFMACICFNIEYDAEGFFSGKHEKRYCAGYSDLFTYLAEKLKLFSVYLTARDTRKPTDIAPVRNLQKQTTRGSVCRSIETGI